MDRNDAIQLLRDAGITEDHINEDSILIARVIGAAVLKAFTDRLATKIVSQTSVAHERQEGAVDYQAVTCKCGYKAFLFNQVPLVNCPRCGEVFEDILSAEFVE